MGMHEDEQRCTDVEWRVCGVPPSVCAFYIHVSARNACVVYL